MLGSSFTIKMFKKLTKFENINKIENYYYYYYCYRFTTLLYRNLPVTDQTSLTGLDCVLMLNGFLQQPAHVNYTDDRSLSDVHL